MIFVHDIFLNLQKNYYDFFEWNKNDTIFHIKKIPIIKISSQDLKMIKENAITLNNDITKKYEKKAEYFTLNKKDNIVILSDSNIAIAIIFDIKGNIIKKSSLIFDDEESVFKKISQEKYQKIIYKCHKQNNNYFLTRNEQDNKKYMLKNIKRLDKNKLIYLYYDCFNKTEKNINNLLNKIIFEIKNNNMDIWNKCLKLINLVYQQNK